MQVVSGEKNAPQEWELRAAKVLHLNLLNVCFLCDHVRYLPVYLWKDKLRRAGITFIPKVIFHVDYKMLGCTEALSTDSAVVGLDVQVGYPVHS